MKTIIELYDERPLENVLSTEVFHPENTVFLCPPEVSQNNFLKQKIIDYINHRKLKTKIVFVETKLYSAKDVEKKITQIVKKYPECALDVTGGSDAALFAAGIVCAKYNLPSFTYSRKQNTFYNISNAPFADKLKCEVKYTVADFFGMAGGALRKGRVDNNVLVNYMDKIDGYFALYLKHKNNWTNFTTYMQKASFVPKEKPLKLHVEAPYSVKGERVGYIPVAERLLSDLEKLGFVKNLKIIKNTSVSFDFADFQVRNWLRDVGSVLELYVYKACLDTGIFNDVVTSAVVDWEGVKSRDGVTNEIDVMASLGVIPLFISCKTCEIDTDSLNELAILRDRFGGKMAKAAIVTAKHCRSVTHHRANELGIYVIELEELRSGKLKKILSSIAKKS